jgi:hypothetical protein
VRITKLSTVQRLGWYFSSAVYGLCLVAIGTGAEASGGPAPVFSIAVFLVSWLVGVFGLRLYLQDKDPTSFRSILGLDQKDRPTRRGPA